MATLEERFWPKVAIAGPDECWLWTGAKVGDGYGSFCYDGRRSGRKNRNAHRVAYELLVGPIPAGLEIDHLCRVPACVNPAHLEPVTHRENGLRGNSVPARNFRKTHCVNGHPFDDANTYIRNGRRGCRACNLAAVLAYKRRRAAA